MPAKSLKAARPKPPSASSNIGDTLQVNVAAASQQELAEWTALLRRCAHEVYTVRLLCYRSSRDASGRSKSGSKNGGRQSGAGQGVLFSSEQHRAVAAEASAKLTSEKLRSILPDALSKAVSGSNLHHLEVRVRLPSKFYEQLSGALAANTSLEVLSLAGSCCGDAALAVLLPALTQHPQLKVLELPGCCLTDTSAGRLATLIKAQGAAAAQQAWMAGLRGGGGSARLQHQASSSTATQAIGGVQAEQNAQGLRVLDLSQNQITAAGLNAIAAALAEEHSSIMHLNLANNQLPAADAAASSILQALQHDPPSRNFTVDLSGNIGPAGVKFGVKSGSEAAPTIPELSVWAGILHFNGATAAAAAAQQPAAAGRFTRPRSCVPGATPSPQNAVCGRPVFRQQHFAKEALAAAPPAAAPSAQQQQQRSMHSVTGHRQQHFDLIQQQFLLPASDDGTCATASLQVYQCAEPMHTGLPPPQQAILQQHQHAIMQRSQQAVQQHSQQAVQQHSQQAVQQHSQQAVQQHSQQAVQQPHSSSSCGACSCTGLQQGLAQNMSGALPSPNFAEEIQHHAQQVHCMPQGTSYSGATMQQNGCSSSCNYSNGRYVSQPDVSADSSLGHMYGTAAKAAPQTGSVIHLQQEHNCVAAEVNSGAAVVQSAPQQQHCCAALPLELEQQYVHARSGEAAVATPSHEFLLEAVKQQQQVLQYLLLQQQQHQSGQQQLQQQQHDADGQSVDEELLVELVEVMSDLSDKVAMLEQLYATESNKAGNEVTSAAACANDTALAPQHRSRELRQQQQQEDYHCRGCHRMAGTAAECQRAKHLRCSATDVQEHMTGCAVLKEDSTLCNADGGAASEPSSSYSCVSSSDACDDRSRSGNQERCGAAVGVDADTKKCTDVNWSVIDTIHRQLFEIHGLS